MTLEFLVSISKDLVEINGVDEMQITFQVLNKEHKSTTSSIYPPKMIGPCIAT